MMKRQDSKNENDISFGHARTRFNPRRGTYRLRFPAMHEDQLESVLAALHKARGEADTNFDSVALEMICLAYLGSGAPKSAINCKSLLHR